MGGKGLVVNQPYSSHVWRVVVVLAVGLVLSVSSTDVLAQRAQGASDPRSQAVPPGSYVNPIAITWAGHGKVNKCTDPSIIYSEDKNWYVYCGSGVLNDQDNKLHLIPELKSPDLVHYVYAGDALTRQPSWVAPGVSLLAPDIRHFNNKYYLYFTAPETVAEGSAIGVLTGSSATGPWTDSGGPVVEPHAAPCCPNDKMWVFDSSLAEQGGQQYIFYGSYFGGIQARKLSADGLHSDPASQTQVTIDNRFEASHVVQHGGYYYLFASSTSCCNGPLTGYGEYVGRSQKVLGPYVDRDGHSLLEARTGGSIVLAINGNRWTGPGGGSVFADLAGKDWIVYDAIDRNHPYMAGVATNANKRQLLLDPLDWVNGWPTVRGGNWASDAPLPAPAAQAGQTDKYRMSPARADEPGAPLPQLSDNFKGTRLSSHWRWVRPPATSAYGIGPDGLHMETQAADLYLGTNDASVLVEPAPTGDYVVESKVKLSVPAEGCCFNYVQAALLIYKGDDNYIKLDVVSNWDTRQTEFAKELRPVPAGYPRYGETLVGPPADWTWLRIVKTMRGKEELYRAYSSIDGRSWDRGGVWTHRFGSKAKIGLAAMAGGGQTATFAYVHVYRLKR